MGTTASSILTKSAVWDVGIQLGMWAISSLLQTERFYDATGSATYILLACQSYRWGQVQKTRQKVQTSLVVIWALRLGLFLLARIHREGGVDRRFNNVRDNPKVFLIYWVVQALWIFLTILPTIIVNSEKKEVPVGTRDYLGWGLWGLGMFLEVVADCQKTAFNSDPSNKGKFISSGLWSISRHPNYLGEILLWSGLYLSASSIFSGWQHVGVVSPLFVYFLLTRVSGIPMLEKLGMKKFGSNPDYLEYVKKVPVLFPSLW